MPICWLLATLAALFAGSAVASATPVSSTSSYSYAGETDNPVVDASAAPVYTAAEALISSAVATSGSVSAVQTRFVAADSGGDAAYHYTFAKYADSIAKDGLRPGSYATPDGRLSPLQAQLDLALPPNRGLPEIKIRVDVAGLRDAGFAIPDVTRVSSTVTGAGGRVYTMPGGGYQMQFPYAIPGQFLKVEP